MEIIQWLVRQDSKTVLKVNIEKVVQQAVTKQRVHNKLVRNFDLSHKIF